MAEASTIDAPSQPAAMGALTRARLWLSYQRYALLVSIGSVGSLTLTLVVAPGAWYLWVPLALICLPAFALAHHINRGFRAKMVETHRGLRQIRGGTFKPDSVQRLCSDPCSKLVAAELLARSGMPWRERRSLLAKLTIAEDEASKSLVIVDRTNGKVYTYDGGQVTSENLQSNQQTTNPQSSNPRSSNPHPASPHTMESHQVTSEEAE